MSSDLTEGFVPPVTRGYLSEADASFILSGFVWLLGYVEATRPGIPAFVDNAHLNLVKLAGQDAGQDQR